MQFTKEQLPDERLVKILSETQAAINEHNSRCVRGSVEVDARLFESMLVEIQLRRHLMEKAALAGMEADKLPSQGSNEVNEAAWILHDQLTKLGPLNGHQFNNLKGCFYEALKVAMRNSPVIPDWQSEAEKMAELGGSSFVLFRRGESPQCADPSKVVISFTDEGHTWSPGLIHPENCQCDEHRSAMLQSGANKD